MRTFALNQGLPSINDMRDELEEMLQVLLGHEPPPVNNGVMTLMEVSEAYHARAMYLAMQIQRAEAEGFVTRGSKTYKFRTGELRTFIELASKAIELGSRRITAATTDYQMRMSP